MRARGGEVAAREREERRDRAVRVGHGQGMGRSKVGDAPDRWASPIGERVREGGEERAGGRDGPEEISWAAAEKEKKEELGRGEEKEGEGGEWALSRMGMGFEVWVCFFFQILFKQLFKNLFKSNLLHLFHNYFKDF
jgi:hypothetical protein